jgi:hypothetical protein
MALDPAVRAAAHFVARSGGQLDDSRRVRRDAGMEGHLIAEAAVAWPVAVRASQMIGVPTKPVAMR